MVPAAVTMIIIVIVSTANITIDIMNEDVVGFTISVITVLGYCVGRNFL